MLFLRCHSCVLTPMFCVCFPPPPPGTIKRYGMKRGAMTHGSKSHREHGSTGPGTTPGRTLPGLKMAGHMGAQRRKCRSLQVRRCSSRTCVLLLALQQQHLLALCQAQETAVCMYEAFPLLQAEVRLQLSRGCELAALFANVVTHVYKCSADRYVPCCTGLLLLLPQVLKVDTERNAIVVKGSVPGKAGNILEIAPAKIVGTNC